MSANIYSTQDPVEIAKFNRLADLWWDPNGQMWPLHRLNHLRTPFVAQEILRHFGTDSLQGLRVLDIGCGAGLLAEPLARQGASVTGIDVAGKNIANPTSLLLSGLNMLRHLGMMEKAAMIENALLYTLESGVHTGDFGDKSIPSVNTTVFAQTIIDNFGKQPTQNPKPNLKDFDFVSTNR